MMVFLFSFLLTVTGNSGGDDNIQAADTRVVKGQKSIDWEKYMKRLEGISLSKKDGPALVDRWGNYYFATKGVSYRGDPEMAWKIVLLALRDANSQVQRESLAAAKYYGTPDRSQDLLSLASLSNFSHLRHLLVHVIGFIGDSRAILPLTQMLRDNQNDKRLLVSLACALGRLGGAESEVGPLIYLAEHNADLVVRCSAMLSIGRSGLMQGRSVLVGYLDSPHKEERFSALIGLISLDAGGDEDSKTQKRIMGMTRTDKSYYVRMASAFHILKRYGFKAAYARIIGQALKKPHYVLPALDFIGDLKFPYYINILRGQGSSRKLNPWLKDRIVQLERSLRRRRLSAVR